MPSEPRGASIFPVEVGSITKTGFLLLIDDRELYLPFDAFPWFRNAAIDALTKIERPSLRHLYWPELDVDLAVESIEWTIMNDSEMPFNKAAHQVLALAGDEAQRLGLPYVGTEHLAVALTRQTQGALGAALRTLGVDGERVRAMIETIVPPGTGTTTYARLSYTSRTKRIFALAKESARAFERVDVGPEHLLIGVLREATGIGGQVLMHHGLSADAAVDEIRRLTSGT